MSAEVLREAAAKMRERAEAATPGPWTYLCSTGRAQGGEVVTYTSADLESSVTVECGPDGGATFDCEHFASWHPAVALAVADWLDEEADHWTDPDDDGLTYYRAYVVATTYLGEAS